MIEKDKTLPKAGESNEKVVNGTTMKWCGKCKYWKASSEAFSGPSLSNMEAKIR